MITVVVLEDEKKVYDLIADALRKEGYSFVDEPESGGLVKIVKRKVFEGTVSPYGSRVLMLKELLIKEKKGMIYRSVIPEIERPLIESVMEDTEGNKSKAARILGINRNTLNAKIKKLHIDDRRWKS
ncbi:MAG: helix-turn-helix domain-containing protein [Candidatus Omnitrophica bacterium]|nr:helix-turn-helix domain-containing protein [Candidatus Omnitrophota bacterium]